MLTTTLLLLGTSALGQASGGDALAAKASAPALTWKAGTAVAKITPADNIWMAGYAARKKPSEGVAQDLFAKALALEDEAGSQLVIVTMDLIGVRRDVRENVLRAITSRHKLPAERLLLNASHTHCGPEYRPRPGREAEAKHYQAKLESTLIDIIGQALADLRPARLSYAHARCGFAMNRRLPTPTGYQNRPNSEGPVDHDVPVLTVYDADGKLRTAAFGYACHNTTLSSVTKQPEEPRYLINGDYAGFAQQSFEQMFPGSVAMFVNGCSGDQNPYPRHAEVPGMMPLELAAHHGRSLALSAAAGIQSVQRPIVGKITAAIGEVTLTRNNDKPAHDYTAQVIRLGDEVTLVALSSETVVDYSLRLKREIATPVVWVAGYSNDVVGYIPSRRVAGEGGYEAGYDFTFDVEDKIIKLVHELAASLDVPIRHP